MRSLRVALTAGLAAVGFATAETILPYNPTSIFLSPIDPNIVYILQPPSIGDIGTGRNGGLAKLDISESIKSEDVEALFIDNSLPLGTGGTQGGGTDAYSAWIMPDGSIGLYAGNCDSAGTADSTTASSLWIHRREEESEDAGSWTTFVDELVPTKELQASELRWDASYLATTFYFSPVLLADERTGSIYTFGGMCPWQDSTGQRKANYTNTMLKMSERLKDKVEMPIVYDITHAGISSLKPVPEAGSTMTGLSPTTSNYTGQKSVAQDFVLIGGHTQGAFIGMSQVAVFSLPQEVWTFQAVEAASEYNTTEPVVPAGSDDGRELKVSKKGKRDGEWKSVPDSRSGHTAVLSSDGSKIIVFGGWVGDLQTPAEPQLAVLHLGSGFGGEGGWRWEIPTVKGIALIEREGIFGHGAVMLPGDILMIAGGYRIVSSNNTKRKEASGVSAMFLNTTSMSFLDTYVNPAYAAPQSEDPQAPGYIGGPPSLEHDNSKKVGIGAGVGVGVLAILGAIVIYFWYRRKLNRRHTAAREKDLAQLSQSVHWDSNNAEKMHQRIGSGSIAYGQAAYGPGNGNGFGDMGYATPGAAYGPIEYQGYDHGHVDDSSISYVQPLQRNNFQIPRKPPNARNARGYYQPAPPQAANNAYSSFDFGAGTHSRTNSLGTAGAIHPIYEQDEDDHGEITDSHLIGVARGETTPTPMEGGDPFDDKNQTYSQRNSAASMGKLELRPQPLEPPPTSPHRDHNPRLKLSPSEEKLEKQREVQEWVSDWAAADAYAMGHTASTIHHNNPLLNRSPSLLQAHGGLSPSKTETTVSYSGRTDSNLSDQSAVTLSRNDSTSTRTKSLTAFFQNTSGWGLFGGASNMAQHGTPARRPEVVNNAYLGPASGRVTAESFYPSGSISPGESERSNTLTATGAAAGQAAHLKPPRSSGSISNHSSGNGSHSGNSYMTAHSQLSAGFTGLKEQAETLLPRYGDWAGGNEPGSPSKSKSRSRKGSMGWLGSIKKLVGREEWVGSPGTEEGERETMRERGVADYGAYDINTYAESPSPTRINFGGEDPYSGDSYGGMPQRTASAGASLWRRKQGRSDWEDGEDERGMYGGLGGGCAGVHRSFTTATPRALGRDERAEEEDWDVEKALQGRQVQVMFTVPKERLRVVNHDISDDESDIGVVRGSSNRSAGSAVSARSNRGRRSSIRDLLMVSPQRSPTRESMRQEVDLELGTGDLGTTTASSKKGKEVLRDLPSLQPIQHTPPPMTDTQTSDAERDANMTPEPLMVVKRPTPSSTPTEERRPISPFKHLPPPRDASPARSDTSTGTISRPLSPTKSLRSIKSGRVHDLVKQMEKK